MEHGLQEQLFQQVLELLQKRNLILKKGTIVDSTIIAAPSSTKNREKKRDPDACQTKKGKKIRYKIKRRPSQSKNNSARSKGQIKRREREKSSVRAKVEHVFGVVKGLLGYRKTRYKGRRKQTAKLHMMFALANLYRADKRCLTA